MIRKIFLTVLAALLLAGCTSSDEVINIYSGRHYEAAEDLFREFTRQTGIQVNLVKADTDQLIKRLDLEGAGSPADLLITVDAGRLITAKSLDLLQAFQSELVNEVVPPSYRDTDGTWTGLTVRARVIVYHKDRVGPADLSTYEALAGPEWRGRVLVRSSQNHYNQTLMASMVAALGPEAAESWVRGLVENMARSPQGNDRDQVKALAAGTGDVAIVNTYYMGLLLNSPNAEERGVAQKTGILFPNQNDRGTHVNISGIGLTRHAPNSNNAIRLIEFMLSNTSQKILSEANCEYPVSVRVPWPEQLLEWGAFRADTLRLSELQPHLQEAMLSLTGPAGSETCFSDEVWSHILRNLLPAYVLNTIWLMLGVALLTFLMGVSTAWLVSMYRFPGRRVFEWALILPIAIPGYINGFAWAGMLDYTSPLYAWLRSNLGIDTGPYNLPRQHLLLPPPRQTRTGNP